MLVPGILGFQTVLFALICFVCLVIRHKSKDAAAKKEEIMRLVAMASEEAALAEVEATVEYTSMPVLRRYQCAVCYSDTTMRCSRCKTVRYCSGKCQIMHWRHGHRDECCLQIGTTEFQDRSDFGENAMPAKQSELYDTKGLRTGFASSCASSSAGFSPSHVGNESYDDISSNQSIRSGTIDRSEKLLSDDVAPDMLSTNSSFNGMELTTLLTTESINKINFVDGKSWASKSTKMKSGRMDEKVDFKAQFSKPKPLETNDAKPKNLSNIKLPRGSALAGQSVADASKFRCLPSLSCSGSDSVGDDGTEGAELSKCKEVRSLSSKASSDHPSSALGRHPLSNSKSGKLDDCHVFPVKVCSPPSLSQDVRNGLKISVQKVVQQFRASKDSKHKLSGLGNDIAGKYNCKIVFPYELFVKLYCYDKVELCPFGLTNCGNSCYANAVLQCLAFTRPLTTYLLHGHHSKSCRKKGWCFICEFECLIQKAKEGYSPLSPIGVLSKIGSNLDHGREEDAHEFLRYAVDTMQSVCLKESGSMGPMAEETTLVGLTFGGYLRSKIKCMKCLGKSVRCEQMMDLTVEIDGNIGTLEEALAQFTATEMLDRDNKYYCNRCKCYEKAKKKLTILELPNILTIVLKRFRSGNLEKLNKSIQFPEVLDMAPYINGTNEKSSLYSLYAVVVHLNIMNAAFSGHYVCYVKNNGDWFRIDDSTVEPVELERVLLEGAYMLLYARHSPRAPAFIRNNGVSDGGRSKKRNLEVVPSSLTTSKTQSNSVAARPSSLFSLWFKTFPHFSLPFPFLFGLILSATAIQMSLSMTHQLGTLAGTPITIENGTIPGESTSTLSSALVWKSPMPNISCRVQNTDIFDALSPPVSPCRSPILGATRPDLSVACRAFATEMEAPAMEAPARVYREGGVQDRGKGVPVYVMMPLDSVTMNNTVNRRKAMNASLQALKSAGVEGVMMDVWWGLVEREAPGAYNWGGYAELLEMAKKHGLKVQAVMSFHRCGGNVGDSVTIPLPNWAVEEMDRDPDLAYTDQWGRRNYEYVSLGCDNLPVLKGRTPVRCYGDFMRAFRDNFKHLLGDTIVEIQVGMGPAGELRYPSYPEQNGTWKFPGIGAFQCYDKYMLSGLKAAAEAVGKPEWGSTGPTDAGHYNNWPEDTTFFRKEGGGWNGPYGEFFLSWYSQMLLDHGERILTSAKSIFGNTGVKFSVKVAGIHWHYGTRSHAPELTAGYYNTRFRNGYLPIAQMLARHDAIFNFTCIEMRDHEQPQDALCAPEKLVRQVALATQKAQVPLAGENALPRYDEDAHEQILQASSLNIDGNSDHDREMCAFTYLRMNPQLFQADNWRRFVAFVKKMKEGKDNHRCWEQVEREAEHFVHVTQPFVQEAAVALMH